MDYASSNFWRVALAVITFGLLFGFRHRLTRAGRKAGRRRRDPRSS